MALNSQLIKLKAPGTKILTTIRENLPQAEAPQGARILVINSKKGPVNRLVKVSSFAEYLRQFDGISDADERRGNWGARSAEYMLTVAPIYVLNLRHFDDTVDKAGLQEMSTTVSVKNGAVKNAPYSSLFNRAQFWTVDPEALIATKNVDKLLTFANVGTTNVSLVIRKTRTVQSTVTFDQWYKNLGKEMPSYVNPNDTVDSWFIDVTIFHNTFNTSTSSNPVYGYLFNTDGTVKDYVVDTSGRKLDALQLLTEIDESGYVGTITGSLVQGFTDERLNDSDIVTVLNSMYNETGIVVARNEAIYDGAAIWYEDDTYASNGKKRPVPVDMKGHNLANITSTETFAIKQVPQQVEYLSYKYNVDVATEPANAYLNGTDKSLKDATIITKEVAFTPSDKKTVTPYAAYVPGKIDPQSNKIVALDKSVLYIVGTSERPNVGANFVAQDGNLTSATKVQNIKTIRVVENLNTNVLAIQPTGKHLAADGTDTYEYPAPGQPFPTNDNGIYVYPTTHPLAGLPLIFKEQLSSTGKLHDPYHSITQSTQGVVDAAYGTDAATLIQNFFQGSPTYNEAENSAMFNKDEDAQLTAALVDKFGKSEYVYEVSFDRPLVFNKLHNDDSEGPNTDPQELTQEIVTDSGVSKPMYFMGYAFAVKSSDESVDSYVPMTLVSYKPRKEQFLDGTAERQSKVLDVLLDKSIIGALSNRDLIKWNYIVDGFKTYIEPNVKYQLKEVAKARIIARAIYNMPSINDFQRSTNPYFSEQIGGLMEAQYIVKGGNLQLPHNNTFSLPSTDGWYAYGFGPNLKLSGSTKTMPPAAVISNLFQKKHLDGKPFLIVAGAEAGAIRAKNVSGVEYVFNETTDGQGDRDYLDPFGYNVIVYKSTGLQIYGNKTSHNTVSTPVSSIHSSEVLMFIQERINSLLEKFVFKLNNSQNRLIIKNQADSICDEALASGAISGYLNVIDATNNTSEIIANRIGILDTTLFDANGMEILVHRTTFDTVTNMASYSLVKTNA